MKHSELVRFVEENTEKLSKSIDGMGLPLIP